MASTSFLHGIDTVEITDGPRPITTLKSSVIGLIGTAGKGPINEPVLITGNQRDAAAIFGAYSADGFSIPKALNAIFKQGGATVVVINVLDPAVHISAATTTDNVVLKGNSGNTLKGFISNITVGTTVMAPYTISSLGANRAYSTVTSGTGTKTKFNVPNGADYTVGELVRVVTSSVSGYASQLAAVTVADGTGITLDIPYTATAAGTLSAPLKDRVVLPTGCVLVDTRNLDTNGVVALSALTVGMRVKVTYTATLVANADYTVDAETGKFTRTLTGSKILPNATLAITYKYVDPTMVTAGAVRGSIAGDGTLTGVELLAASQSKLGVRPRLLIAPGFTLDKPDASTRNSVAVALAAMASKLRATAYVSATNETKEGAVGYASDFYDPRVMVLYPSVNFAQPGDSGGLDPVTLDTLAVGLIAATDNDPSGGFWHSPSNRLLQGPVSLTRTVDWGLSDTESAANYLNANNVTVAIREDGFRLWGNRMSDGTFITTRRVADMIEDSIAAAHRWAVDRNITKGYLANLQANVNDYLAMLERQGAILGGKAWIDPTLNTPSELANGHVYVDYEFTPPVPAERITFRAHLVNDYFSKILES